MPEDVQRHNEEQIEEFLKTRLQLSGPRILKHRVCLRKVSRHVGKTFEDVTQDELRAYVDRINAREDYSDWTKMDYRVFLKRFFGWLHDPSFVEWIKRGTAWSRVRVEDLLTDSELQLMRQACDNPRDRALLETAYESALRPDELLRLKKTSVVFDDYGAIVSVERGKTGPRRVRVIRAAPLLADWITNHPLKEKEARLWVDISHNTTHYPLGLAGLSNVLSKAALKVGVRKRVHPYLFRHTRLTHLSKLVTESVLCQFAGWKQGSEMARNYVHLSGRDVDEAIIRAYGVKKSGETLPSNLVMACARCGTTNPSDGEVCRRCGFALSDLAAFRRDDQILELKEAVEQMRNELNRLSAQIDRSGR